MFRLHYITLQLVQVFPWTELVPKPVGFVLNSLCTKERAWLVYQPALFTVIFPSSSIFSNSTVVLGTMLKVDNLCITIKQYST